jgi:hypothetical protein
VATVGATTSTAARAHVSPFITLIIERPPSDPADSRAWFEGLAPGIHVRDSIWKAAV